MELELWKMKQEEEFIKGLKWVPLSLSLSFMMMSLWCNREKEESQLKLLAEEFRKRDKQREDTLKQKV